MFIVQYVPSDVVASAKVQFGSVKRPRPRGVLLILTRSDPPYAAACSRFLAFPPLIGDFQPFWNVTLSSWKVDNVNSEITERARGLCCCLCTHEYRAPSLDIWYFLFLTYARCTQSSAYLPVSTFCTFSVLCCTLWKFPPSASDTFYFHHTSCEHFPHPLFSRFAVLKISQPGFDPEHVCWSKRFHRAGWSATWPRGANTDLQLPCRVGSIPRSQDRGCLLRASGFNCDLIFNADILVVRLIIFKDMDGIFVN